MSEEPAEYYVSKAPKPLRRLDYLRKRLQNWFTDLSAECRCYAVGTSILTFAFFLAVYRQPESRSFAQFGVFAFALGLLPLIELLYEWAWRRMLGKLLIVTLIAIATNIAYGFGRQIVSGLVGTFPESFSGTVSIATLLSSPVIFLMFLAIGGFFIFAIALYVGSLALMAVLPSTVPGKGKRTVLWICRFVALAISVFGSMALLSRSDGYAGWVERRAAGYLYTFDMYHDADYAAGETEKVALLGDGRLLVASPEEEGGYDFEIRNAEAESKGVGE